MTSHQHVPRPPRFAAIAGLTGGHLVNDLYLSAVPALLPFLVAERHYGYPAAAGIILAATVLSSVAQPVFGVLTDRHQLWWLLPAGMATAGIGVGLSGLGNSYVLTWLAIALSGLGVAAYHPEASRAAHQASAGSAQGMSWFSLGGNVGLALGPILVTLVLSAQGLTATPLLTIPALVTVAIIIGRVRSNRRVLDGPDRAGAHTGETVSVSEPARPDDWRAFGWLTTLVVCRSITFYGIAAFLALYLTQHLGASIGAANAALSVLLASGAAGTLLGGWLADRLSRPAAVRIGYALTLICLPGVILAPVLPLAYLACALLGLALYIPFSVHVTMGQEYLPTRIGTASGVTLGLAVSVGGTMTPLLGVLADHTGLAAALGLLLVFPTASLALSTRLPRAAVRSPLMAA